MVKPDRPSWTDRLFTPFEKRVKPLDGPDPGPPPPGGLAFIRHYATLTRGAFTIMLLLGFLQALVEAALFVFVGVIVDLMASGPRDSFMADNAGALLAMAGIVLVVRFAVQAGMALLEEQVVVPNFFTLVRWHAHKVVSRQDVAFFDEEMAGRVSSKVWQAGQAAGDFMVSLLQIIWFIAVFAATTLLVIASLSPAVMAPVLVWISLVGVIAWTFVPVIRDRGRALAESVASVTGRMVDGYTNIRTVKLYGAEDAQDAHILAAWRKTLTSLLHFTRSISGLRIASNGLSSIMLVAIAGVAIWQFQNGELSAGEVAVVFALCLRLNLLMNRLLGLLNGLFRNLGTVQNSAEMISRPRMLADEGSQTLSRMNRGHLRFEGVRFGYNGGYLVIDGLDLEVKPGERVGLVGRSGAGKTTIANLLLRFYERDGGLISMDGTDIKTVSQHALRSAIGVVTQEPALLHRSIRDNIAYGRPDATQDEIEAVAKRAQAHDFIVDLQDANGRTGYDTHVGERGVKLSGGQRQRIALARVFLKNAPVLLLDEATSALDSTVEAAIQDNLDELMQGKTVIAIAHRLSTIRHLDRLVVLDKGRIVEEGSHDDLLAANGIYAQLWARQTGGRLV